MSESRLHLSGAAPQLPQPGGLGPGPEGSGRFPGLPGLGSAQQQGAAAAEQTLAVRRGGGAS